MASGIKFRQSWYIFHLSEILVHGRSKKLKQETRQGLRFNVYNYYRDLEMIGSQGVKIKLSGVKLTIGKGSIKFLNDLRSNCGHHSISVLLLG